jgi:UDP-N-acetyl-2-amino-2-deoxyglucuronate dehydrogenase
MSASSDPLGFAVVGSGAIASTHIEAIQAQRDLRLIGLHGRNPQTSRILAEKYQTKAFPSLEALLGEPGLDGVLLATPSGAHLEPALAAFAAGKHVLSEKPLEVTTARCERMVEAARESGCLLGGFFPMRTRHAAQRMKDAVEAGRFGRLTFVSARVKWWRDPDYYRKSSWRGTWALDGGGALMNQGCHAVDLMIWLAGHPERISASMDHLVHREIEAEDTLAAQLRFQNGALGTIEATTSSYPGLDLSIELSGERGTVVMENNRIARWSFAEEKPEDEGIRAEMDEVSGSGAGNPKVTSCEGHRRQLAAFAGAIRNPGSPYLSGEEAATAVAVIEAAYQSAREQRVVKVDPIA